MAGSMGVVFLESTRRGLSQSSFSKKLAFIHSVMTGREAKTPIEDKNYTQVQRDNYTRAMTDLSYACETDVKMD